MLCRILIEGSLVGGVEVLGALNAGNLGLCDRCVLGNFDGALSLSFGTCGGAFCRLLLALCVLCGCLSGCHALNLGAQCREGFATLCGSGCALLQDLGANLRLGLLDAADAALVEPQAQGTVGCGQHCGCLGVPGNVEATLLSVGVHRQNLVVDLFALQGLSNDAANTLVGRCLEGQLSALQQGPRAHASAGGQRVVCVQAANGLGRQGQAACQRLREGQFVGGQLGQAVTLTGFTRLNSGRNNGVGEVAQLLPRPNPSTAVLGFGAQQVRLERERGSGLKIQRLGGEIHVPLGGTHELSESSLVLGGDKDRCVDKVLQRIRHASRLATF